MSWPEPTSWDRPSVLASGTSLPSTEADRSMETKSPSSTARSTPVRVPKRARRFCSSVSTSSSVTSMGSTSILSASRSGMVDVGADVDLGGEDEFFAVLELGDLDVGLAERLAPRRW